MTGKKVQNIHITGFLLNIMKEKKSAQIYVSFLKGAFPGSLLRLWFQIYDPSIDLTHWLS